MLKVERAILSSVEFPSVLSSCQIILRALGVYQATFDEGTEKHVKDFGSLQQSNSWLVSMTNSYKKGDLHKQLKIAEANSRAETAFNKAIDLMATGNKLEDALASPSNPKMNTQDQTDVTMSMLRPPRLYTCQKACSTIGIHRGSIQSLLKLCSTNRNLRGILLGKKVWNGKFHAVQIVVSSEDHVDLVSSNEILNKCKHDGLEPCGFLMVGQHAKLRERVLDLFGTIRCESPLFIGIDFDESLMGKQFYWELVTSHETANDPFIRRMQPSWSTQPRDAQRKQLYSVCWVSDLKEVSSLTGRVCEAVMKQISLDDNGSSQCKTTKPMSCENQRYRRLSTPADGFCGWHSLLAAGDIEAYEKIPRNKSGYAKARLMVQKEEESSKELCNSICQQALEVLDPLWHPRVLRVMEQGDFGPCDLEWISCVAGMSIRCTCCAEARISTYGHRGKGGTEIGIRYVCIFRHTYIHIYIYPISWVASHLEPRKLLSFHLT